MRRNPLLNTLLYAFCIFLIASTRNSVTVGADEDAMPTISVTGTAEIQVVPDEAELTFSIESREEQLDATVADNDQKIKAVTEFLKQSKVDPKYIRTQVINIRPIFAESGPKQFKGQIAQQSIPMPRANAANPAPTPERKPSLKPIGYTARRQLSVTIRDLDAFETIYQGLIERGVNDVSGFQFRTTELRKHKDEARIKAVRAAREKAQAMAKELGATLAAVQTITEDSGYRYPNFASNSMSIATGDESTSTIAAGMIEITATVRIVFRLGDVEFK